MNLEDELEETEIEGFYAHAQTLFCQNAVHDQFVQVSSLIIPFLIHIFHFCDFNLSF